MALQIPGKMVYFIVTLFLEKEGLQYGTNGEKFYPFPEKTTKFKRKYHIVLSERH